MGHFPRAREIASGHETHAFEPCAATFLSGLSRSQSKTHAAHDLLASVYNRFTDGFDTPDLKDVKALLEELS